jgi:hypothetical protein
MHSMLLELFSFRFSQGPGEQDTDSGSVYNPSAYRANSVGHKILTIRKIIKFWTH